MKTFKRTLSIFAYEKKKWIKMQLQKQDCNINFMNTDNTHKHIFPYYYLYDGVSDFF